MVILDQQLSNPLIFNLTVAGKIRITSQPINYLNSIIIYLIHFTLNQHTTRHSRHPTYNFLIMKTKTTSTSSQAYAYFEKARQTIPQRTVPKRQPFNLSHWKKKLASHPSQSFQNYILNGIKHGFRIGYSHGKPHNYQHNFADKDTATQNAVTDWIFKGVQEGYILGPFKKDEVPIKNVVISPMGTVPKNKHTPEDGLKRPIHNLSAPKRKPGRTVRGLSVNDSLKKHMTTVTYPTFKKTVRLVHAVGPDGAIWIIDMSKAFLRIPTHQSDWWLLGLEWQGYIFIIVCLPFGLASAPKIYTAFADALEWIMQKDPSIWTSETGIKLILHYLDDYFAGHPDHYCEE